MFIKEIQSKYTYTDKFNIIRQDIRKVMHGQLYNGDNIAIDRYYINGKIQRKMYVIWNDYMEKIVNKIRKPNDKGFDVIG